MNVADYYDILGVSRDATADEIKRAFRKLARETHPDANPDDAEAEHRFREIAEAYEILREIRPLDDPRPVYLRSDQEVPYGFVVRVMGVLQDAGIPGLNLVVDPSEEN